jgi:Fe-S cluster assembly scaffold protein SufB
VAEGKAYVRCDGLLEIGPGGGGTDAYLTEDVLMLDPTAKIDAVPGLEIKTNDVKASHSATVSRVTPEDLFYFAARGISQAEARRMYVEGFLNSVLNTPLLNEQLLTFWREQNAAAAV